MRWSGEHKEQEYGFMSRSSGARKQTYETIQYSKEENKKKPQKPKLQ